MKRREFITLLGGAMRGRSRRKIWSLVGSRLAQGALASASKSLAQINKSPDVGKATKKRSAPVDAEQEGPNSSFPSALLNLPGHQPAGAFSVCQGQCELVHTALA